MEIFRVRLDSNNFQRFLPVKADIWQTDILKMDCRPKVSNWKSPEIYIHNPKRTVGNFFHLCSGAVVADELATAQLRSILEMAGELLPLSYGTADLSLVNVLECVNCLDQRKTEWMIGKTTGAKIRIIRYHFDKSRLSESTLFKIPETAAGEVLCVQGLKDPKDEFRSQVEAASLKGLIFEPLWSDEK